MTTLSELLYEITTTNPYPCGCKRMSIKELCKKIIKDPNNLLWLITDNYITIFSCPSLLEGRSVSSILKEVSFFAQKEKD